jgi:transcription elongation GreA/GreB family factor
LPLKIQNDINRLIFQSFTATGKPVNNSYYDNEWSILRRFNNRNNILNEPEIDYQVIETFSPVGNNSSDIEIKLNSVVTIKYLNKDKEINIQLVEYHTKEFETNNGIQKININSPLAISIIGKSIGDRVEIKNTNSLIEIMQIMN